MKIINLKDKSLFDIARNITSILGVGKSKTTDDKNGFIIERTNPDRNLYHTLVIKKFIDKRTRDMTFSLETEEGVLNPKNVNKSMKMRELCSVDVYFPNVMLGEDREVKFKIVDSKGIKKELMIKKQTLNTHIPQTEIKKPRKKLKRFRKDDIIFKEGDEGDEMYIIQKGKIALLKKTKDGAVVLDTMSKNNFFGEMALFGNPKRSATAKAYEDSDLLVISKELFEHNLTKIPSWFVTMFKTLIERLRNTDEMIDSLKQKIDKLGVKNTQ